MGFLNSLKDPGPLRYEFVGQELDLVTHARTVDPPCNPFNPWKNRNCTSADKAALVQLMADLSRFAADHADAIAEIDLNPVIVHPAGEGLTIVDALIVKR